MIKIGIFLSPGNDSTTVTTSLHQLAALAKFLKKSGPASLTDVKTERPNRHSIPQSDWEADKIMISSRGVPTTQVSGLAAKALGQSQKITASRDGAVSRLSDVKMEIAEQPKVRPSLQTPVSTSRTGVSQSQAGVSQSQAGVSQVGKVESQIDSERRIPWTFDWMIDSIVQTPVLAVFPLDLTAIRVNQFV